MNIGAKIKEHRKEKQLNLRALAKITGVSVGYICDLENNKAKNPSIKKLSVIALALNVPLREFFKEE